MSSDDFNSWPPRRPIGNTGPTVLMAAVALCVALAAGGFAYWIVQRDSAALDDPAHFGVVRPPAPSNGLYLDEEHVIKLYNDVKASVVHITSLSERRVNYMNVQQVPEGTGSGFIWDDGGHIVTNFHVIKDASAAQVTIFDQSTPATYRASLVGAFPDKDIAVLKIDAPKDRLHAIPVGTSDNLQVGQSTFAIGNPFGLDQTLTRGIVSALGREIESVTRRSIGGVIQTDAAINPGNSGGPLLDSSGRLIGMNTAIYSPSGSSAGIGFAIPIDDINRVVAQLIANGRITRPGLGIEIISDSQMKQLNKSGVLIARIRPDSAAEKAGLRGTMVDNGQVELGDIIVALDKKPIARAKDLFNALEKHKVGDAVVLTIEREGEQKEVTATLGPVQ